MESDKRVRTQTNIVWEDRSNSCIDLRNYKIVQKHFSGVIVNLMQSIFRDDIFIVEIRRNLLSIRENKQIWNIKNHIVMTFRCGKRIFAALKFILMELNWIRRPMKYRKKPSFHFKLLKFLLHAQSSLREI